MDGSSSRDPSAPRIIVVEDEADIAETLLEGDLAEDEVDVAVLAQEVWDDLSWGWHQEAVDFRVEGGVLAVADEQALHVSEPLRRRAPLYAAGRIHPC